MSPCLHQFPPEQVGNSQTETDLPFLAVAVRRLVLEAAALVLVEEAAVARDTLATEEEEEEEEGSIRALEVVGRSRGGGGIRGR